MVKSLYVNKMKIQELGGIGSGVGGGRGFFYNFQRNIQQITIYIVSSN